MRHIRRTIYLLLFICPIIFLIIALSSAHDSSAAGYEKHLKKVMNKSESSKMRNIDFIYIINLDERPEKLAKSYEQLHPYGIYPCRFSAINGWKLTLEAINDVGVKFEPWMNQEMWGASFSKENGELIQKHEIMNETGKTYFFYPMRLSVIGIALSHLSILKDAYDSGYQTIWVMEDDIHVIQDPRLIPDLVDKLDRLVGEGGWDILFTDVDFRNYDGSYGPCYHCASRPNFTPSDPSKFEKREKISEDFTRVGARYATTSMIIRRSGMKKLLDFYNQYAIFSAIDMDYVLPEGMHLFTLNYDVVSNLTDAISDNLEPNYKKKE